MADTPYTKLATEEPQAPLYQAISVPDARDEFGLRVGAWDVPFFACFTHVVPNCLITTVLPCVTMAQIAHRLQIARFAVVLVVYLAAQLVSTILNVVADPNQKYGQFPWAPASTAAPPVVATLAPLAALPSDDDEEVTALQVIAGIFSGAFAVAVILFNWHLRTKIRQRFQIPGTALKDGCAVFWCSCCALAQMATQVHSYEPGQCDFGPPDVLPAYQQ